jgi:hypothetical protein
MSTSPLFRIANRFWKTLIGHSIVEERELLYHELCLMKQKRKHSLRVLSPVCRQKVNGNPYVFQLLQTFYT